jgi:subtilisin family serine protease
MNKGDDIDIYILDTGARVTHQEFGGRMTFLFNAVNDGHDTDNNGHGTFTSSEIGGNTYGVLKNARLYAVKVLDDNGDGDLFSIEAGVMQVIETSQQNTSRRGVANLSLGGPKSSSFDQSVATLVTNNIVTVVSAGNSGQDACNFSPANLGGSTNVITVGASDSNDFKPSWSNWGGCVTISAPGAGVTGAWFNCDSCINVISGTSMSAPLVAGVAGIILQQDLTLTVAQVKTKINQWSTMNIVDYTSQDGGGKNLLFSLIDVNAMPPPSPSPPPLNTLPPVFQGNSVSINKNMNIFIQILLPFSIFTMFLSI